MAEQKAKELSLGIFKGDIAAPTTVTAKDTYRMSAEIVKKSRQRQWYSTGRYTYSLIPRVSTKVIFPKEHNIGITYIRMMVHNTMLKDDSYRTGISESALCDCGK